MKKPFNIKKFFKYLLSAFGYFCLSQLDEGFAPFALALLIANLYVGLKPFTSFLLYSFSFVPSFSLVQFCVGIFAGFVVCFTFYVYKKLNKKPSLEIAVISALGLAPYCYFSTTHTLSLRIIICAFIILSSFIMTSGARVWLLKGLKYKLQTSDFCSASFLYFCCSYGAIIAFGEGLYFAFSIFFLLCSSIFIKGYAPVLVGALISLPIAVFRLDFNPIAVFSIYALAISLASNYSKLLVVLLCATITSLIYFCTNYFYPLDIYSPFYSFVSLTLYLFFPDKLCQRWNKTLAIHRQDNSFKISVNMHRNLLSSRIFEMSAVFDEMKSSIEKLKETVPCKEFYSSTIVDKVLVSFCSSCSNYAKCKSELYTHEKELEKIVDLGLIKGSLNLVDLPKNFSNICLYPEDVVDFLNSYVSKYSSLSEEKYALKQSRDLIIKQTEGLSFALKELATDLCKQLQSDTTEENQIKNNLLKCGINIKEISCFKGGEDEEIIIVLLSDYLSHPLLLKAIDEITGYKSVIATNNRISQELSAITIKRAPPFDAMFGIANKIKFDKQKSGDTHSIIKLNEGKFLIALNDGMGSGERAEEISATAISLIETFYKAGLKSETVLPTVNKLLAFGEEDNFTALDVGVVDLFKNCVDFVKIGSPYSFILTKDTVKIIEGNSLPLGILEEINPTVCKTELQSGDVIIFVSDGITDAFETSADLIDFLSMQKALNPKTLADNILERALYLNGGIAKDDMTAFCVRIFKKGA